MSLDRIRELGEELAHCEREEEKSIKLYNAALDVINAGVFEYDCETESLKCNDTMLDTFNLSTRCFKQDKFGWIFCTFNDILERIHFEDLPPLQSIVESCNQPEASFSQTIRVKTEIPEYFLPITMTGKVHIVEGRKVLIGLCVEA